MWVVSFMNSAKAWYRFSPPRKGLITAEIVISHCRALVGIPQAGSQGAKAIGTAVWAHTRAFQVPLCRNLAKYVHGQIGAIVP